MNVPESKRLLVIAALDRFRIRQRVYFAREVGFETAVIAEGSTPSCSALHGLVLHLRSEDEGVEWFRGWDRELCDAVWTKVALCQCTIEIWKRS